MRTFRGTRTVRAARLAALAGILSAAALLSSAASASADTGCPAPGALIGNTCTYSYSTPNVATFANNGVNGQTLAVPAHVPVTITADGAQGGAARSWGGSPCNTIFTPPGGLGGQVSGQFRFSSPDTLTIYIGAAGSYSSFGGQGGGGPGDDPGAQSCFYGGKGGGGAYVFASSGAPLAVAGGGGGGGSGDPNSYPGGAGGAGGGTASGLSGSPGSPTTSAPPGCGTPGQGGGGAATQVPGQGGAGSPACSIFPAPDGQPGKGPLTGPNDPNIIGGHGGLDTIGGYGGAGGLQYNGSFQYENDSGMAGGGGGGYTGGGGGGDSPASGAGGGGGGSGFVSSEASSVSGQTGGWFGNAQVTVSFPAGASISGRVVRGTDGTHVTPPERGADGVLVKVSGTTSAAQPFSGSATTDSSGNYDINAPSGSYTVTFPDTVCVRGHVGCVHTAPVQLGDTSTEINGVALETSLEVTIKTKPTSPVEVGQAVKGPVPTKVQAIVTVKNPGPVAVSEVSVLSDLVITVAHGSPKVFEIPISQSGKPAPRLLGTIEPGQSKQSVYQLSVRGDGKYQLDAVAEGRQPGLGQVGAVGQGIVEIRSPLLVWTAEMGRVIHSPDAPRLVQAGTAFTVRIHLENRSYQKTVAVMPMHALLDGNAQDGHVQLDGQPIQVLSSESGCQPGDAVVLEPRQAKDLEAVIRTSSSNPVLTGAASNGLPNGTRATITFDDPRAFVLRDDGTLGAALTAKDMVVAKDSQHYVVHIDDRGFPAQVPRTDLATLAYFTHGLVLGAWNALAGTVHGLVSLKSIIAQELAQGILHFVDHGILGYPHALLTYIQLESELWTSLHDTPAARIVFFNTIGNLELLAFKHAPQLEAEAKRLAAGVDQAVAAHYRELAVQWYSGNWATAAETFGAEAGEAATNVALTLGVASCVLPRLPAALKAFESLRVLAFTRAAEELSRFPVAIHALDALTALGKVPVGMVLDDYRLRQFGGFLYDQAQFLKTYAEKHDLLIVVRPRAAESVRLIKEGVSVIKPELIKVRTVSELDRQFLGYPRDRLAQVVLRRPTLAEAKLALSRAGLTKADGEYQQVIQLLRARRSEYDHYISELEALNRKGEVTLRWNLEANVMSPDVLTAQPTTYKFRLARGPNHSLIPEFRVNSRSAWKTVTGDHDFLQITHANSKPLSTEARATVYQDLSSSVVGMPHGEAASWMDPETGQFDFPLKIAQFEKGTAIQFGFDGQARAVRFVGKLSEFKDPLHYYVHWDGGLVVP